MYVNTLNQISPFKFYIKNAEIAISQKRLSLYRLSLRHTYAHSLFRQHLLLDSIVPSLPLVCT
jgi:hypothetical protein